MRKNAFPENTFQKVGDIAQGECMPGISQRLYVATAILQGLLANSKLTHDLVKIVNDGYKKDIQTWYADTSRLFADALISEIENTEK